MATLSFLEIPALKKLAQTYGYGLHVHDACGGQSFTLEPGEDPSAQVFAAIEAFFAERHMTVAYYDAKKLDFGAQ